MLTEKILELIDKGYSVEFKSTRSPYDDLDMFRVRLVKGDYDAFVHISKRHRKADDLEEILIHNLEILESRKEYHNA